MFIVVRSVGNLATSPPNVTEGYKKARGGVGHPGRREREKETRLVFYMETTEAPICSRW